MPTSDRPVFPSPTLPPWTAKCHSLSVHVPDSTFNWTAWPKSAQRQAWAVSSLLRRWESCGWGLEVFPTSFRRLLEPRSHQASCVDQQLCPSSPTSSVNTASLVRQVPAQYLVIFFIQTNWKHQTVKWPKAGCLQKPLELRPLEHYLDLSTMPETRAPPSVKFWLFHVRVINSVSPLL